jgi:hypothetical protein
MWRKGDVIAARHWITLGDKVAPGRYWLLVGMCIIWARGSDCRFR